eukprot:4512714-Pleurochrysis_carterae.AAC.1
MAQRKWIRNGARPDCRTKSIPFARGNVADTQRGGQVKIRGREEALAHQSVWRLLPSGCMVMHGDAGDRLVVTSVMSDGLPLRKVPQPGCLVGGGSH